MTNATATKAMETFLSTVKSVKTIKKAILLAYEDDTTPSEVFTALLNSLESKTSEEDFISFCNSL